MLANIKLVWGIVLIGTITAVQGLNYHKTNCSARDAKVVQREWGTMWRVADADLRMTLAKDAVLHIVDKHPEAKTLFQRVRIEDPDSGEFGAHCLRIFNYFDLLVNLLQDKEALRKASAHLGHQHAARPGVLRKYFKTFTSYAVNVFSHYGFHFFTWEACLNDMLNEVFEAIPN